ncbi:MAG: DNA alkylation repair protein [bacterium]|nr:DNA alkylation repair protein [bacterium]
MPEAVISDLQQRLDAVADVARKEWFEAYLKHVIEYRGVPMPEVVRTVSLWRKECGLNGLARADQLDVAVSLIGCAHAEDKFAGMVYIQKYLVRHVPAERILEASEDLFAKGAFCNWATSDGYSMRVLGPLIRRGGRGVARRIAGWRTATDLWQRRGSVVPFRAVVSDPSYHPLIEEVIAVLVKERERFIQTGIGWVVSDMAKVHPDTAGTLVERHLDHLSSEVIRRHTRHFPDHERFRDMKRRQERP